MSEEQLSALLAKLKDDAGLQEKIKAAADLDAAIALAKEAGFDVSKADWLKYQASKAELSDEELEVSQLEGVAGGISGWEMGVIEWMRLDYCEDELSKRRDYCESERLRPIRDGGDDRLPRVGVDF